VDTGTGDPRIQLAADRTVFAAERTYAAWVRTGLASLASGVGTKKVLEGIIPEWLIIVAGSVLVAFSAFCFGAAIWRELRPGAETKRSDAPRLPPPLLVGFNAILVLVSAAALLGIWFGKTGGD
jgi:putative membrane protein